MLSMSRKDSIQTREKAYPSASGAAKCCRCGIGFMIEQITNMMTLGDADDRLPPLLDRVPAALPG